MTKYFSSSPRKSILIIMLSTLVCFSLLEACGAAFMDIDLEYVSLSSGSGRGFTITGYPIYVGGDINGDGYDDLLSGSSSASSSKGEVYVFYGGPTSSLSDINTNSLTFPSITGFRIRGNTALSYLGSTMSKAGDMNQDGYGDIILGAYGMNSNKGAAYVIYGAERSSLPDLDLGIIPLNPATTGFMITASANFNKLGTLVRSAGDINKDGYDDFMITADGKVAVIYGGGKSSMINLDLASPTFDLTKGFVVTGRTSDRFGYSISALGDINKDGYDDIIIGAPYQNSNKGAAYVIYGGEKSSMSNIDLTTQTLNPLTTGFTITGNAASNYFGISVATAGDFNKDGYNDIIIGAYGKSTVYVINGAEKSSLPNLDLSITTLNPTTTGFIITGSSSLGYSVSTAGDINQDGYADIISESTTQKEVYVIFGREKSSTSNLMTSALDPDSTGFKIKNSSPLGGFVSSADVNGDGTSDLIFKGYTQSTGTFIIYTACSPCWDCPVNCKRCPGPTSPCTECKHPFVLDESQCIVSCPTGTFNSTGFCKSCPLHCSSCTSQVSCKICEQGYNLLNSRCVAPPTSNPPSTPLSPYTSDDSPSISEAQEEATQAIFSATRGIGSVVCVGSAAFPRMAMVSKIVQNTRYLNLSVTDELKEIYQTWEANMISWQVPNVLSDDGHFKSSPTLFAQYGLVSSFLENFWPVIMTVGIGFASFITCLVLQKFLDRRKYRGRFYSFIQKLVAGSFNFALVQVYGCLDDILFYLVLDVKTNPFNSFYSWASIICAVIFIALGCLLVLFNLWTVSNYQKIKNQVIAKKKNITALDAFNERNKYWELFYSDFNDDNFLSQSFFAITLIRSTLSTFIITVLYDYPVMQTAYLIVLDGAIILFLFIKQPFTTLRGKLAQYYFEIITMLVHMCALILSLQNKLGNSATLQIIFSTSIIYLNTILISGGLGFMFIEIYETIRYKTIAQKPKNYESIAIQTPTEDISDSQNTALISSEFSQSNTDTQKRTNIDSFEQGVSLKNSNSLSRLRQNSNIALPGENIEPSQALASNSNNSFFSDMNLRHRDQRKMPIMIRQKFQQKQRNISVNTNMERSEDT